MCIEAYRAVLISTIIRHDFVSQVAQATMSPCLTPLLEETRSLLLGTFQILIAKRYIEGPAQPFEWLPTGYWLSLSCKYLALCTPWSTIESKTYTDPKC